MLRDWLLTLLVVALPYLVAVAVALLVLSRRSLPHSATLRIVEARTPRLRWRRSPTAPVHREHVGAAPSPPKQRGSSYPLHKLVAALDPTETTRVLAALDDAGFAGDRVEVVTADEVPGLREPIGGVGLRGLLTRLQLSVGDDLDELEVMRRELVHGHALVHVRVHGDDELERARSILNGHGGHAMRHFGRWAITTIDDGAR